MYAIVLTTFAQVFSISTMSLIFWYRGGSWVVGALVGWLLPSALLAFILTAVLVFFAQLGSLHTGYGEGLGKHLTVSRS
jgi:hypothetical protein